MIRATSIRRDGVLGAVGDSITLPFAERRRRRVAMTSDGGLDFLLDLAAAADLKDGDALMLEDGRAILVRAAAEPVADLHADAPAALTRLAWHLGNRHMPTQLFEDRLRIAADHVLEAMAEGLGARVERLLAPFQPEGGAYSQAHAHSHGHESSDGPNTPHDRAGDRP